MAKLVKAKMWEVIKDDGRLGYRGNQGIQAHVKAAVGLYTHRSGYTDTADEIR
jgi:aspartate/methionine/tyrosine aminotransferase